MFFLFIHTAKLSTQQFKLGLLFWPNSWDKNSPAECKRKAEGYITHKYLMYFLNAYNNKFITYKDFLLF